MEGDKKYRRLGPIYGFISETSLHVAIVTMEDEQELVWDLPNDGTIYNDFD